MAGDISIKSLVVNSEMDMNTNRIANVADPIGLQDVATKSYVDNNSSGGGLGVFWLYNTPIFRYYQYAYTKRYGNGFQDIDISPLSGVQVNVVSGDYVQYNLYLTGEYQSSSKRGAIISVEINIDGNNQNSSAMWGRMANDGGDRAMISQVETVKMSDTGTASIEIKILPYQPGEVSWSQSRLEVFHLSRTEL